MSRRHQAARERKSRIASAFRMANMAFRVAGLELRTAYVKKEDGKWCVRSKSNPDWSGGCYDMKAEADDRLAEVEAAKHAKGG